DQHGLFSLRPLDSRVGRGARIPLRQPRRAGSDRHGRLGGQGRHGDQLFLLGGRDSRDGVSRGLHDAVLLRLAGALGARVPEDALRREDPRPERDLVRDHDGFLLGRLDVRHGTAAESAPGLGLRHERVAVRGHRAGLYPARRTHLGHLQRGAAVLPHRRRFRAAGVPRPQGSGGLAGTHRTADARGDVSGLRLSGMIAIASSMQMGASGFALPHKADGTLNYDLSIPMMLSHYFPHGMLGLGLTALLASFMSGMAGNVTAFNTVWTYDIYQAYIHRGASDHHYLNMGRVATVFGIALSVAAAYVANHFNNIMDMLQLLFAFVNAPLFATFLLGMFWKRATGHGAFAGLLSGTAA